MPDDRHHAPGGHYALDADAVCQECGTVNPEGALLCRQCGNNLRDQRLRRVVNGDILAALPDEPSRKREWVLGALGTIGLIIVFLAAFKASDIAMWLVQQESADTAVVQDLWKGGDSGRFDALYKRLEKNPITANSPRATEQPRELEGLYEGRFMIEAPGRPGVSPFAGGAITELVGRTLYFVGVLQNGAEVRGRGQIDEAGSVAKSFEAMVLNEGSKSTAFGYAQLAPDGSFTLMGQTDASDTPVNATLRRVQAQ